MNLRLLLTSSLLGLSLVACNGGGSAPAAIGTVGAVTVQASGTTAAVLQGATTANGVTTASLASIVTQAQLTTLGLSTAPTVAFPSGVTPAGNIAISNAIPSGVSTFSVHAPVALNASRSTESSSVSNATGLVYAFFTPTATLSLPAGSGVSFTFNLINAPTAGVNYHLAYYANGTWTADTFDKGSISGSAVTVTVTPPVAVNLAVGQTYGIALYSIPNSVDAGATAAPTTTASPGATASPSATASPRATSSPTATATPTTAPTTAATTGPTPAATGTVTTSTTLSVQASGGQIGGATATSLTVPVANSVSNLSYSIYTSKPAAVTAPTGVTTVYGYGVITPSATVTFPAGSNAVAQLIVPSPNIGLIPSGQFKLAYSVNGSTWVNGVGSSTVSGTNITLNVSNPITNVDTTLTGGQTYYIAIYQ